MPLTDSELAYVHEIVGLTDYELEDVEELVEPLTEAQLNLLQADVVEWQALRPKGLKLDGGRDGISIDPDRDRRRVRRRVLSKLGISAGGTGGIRVIPVASGWIR